ncbi:Uncharacterised protein [Bordetella pertussis]|nr:Uncharacterised protein [Bordetella pertussis]
MSTLPSSDSKMMAVLSALPLCRCTSRQLADTLSSPSPNHR